MSWDGLVRVEKETIPSLCCIYISRAAQLGHFKGQSRQMKKRPDKGFCLYISHFYSIYYQDFIYVICISDKTLPGLLAACHHAWYVICS